MIFDNWIELCVETLFESDSHLYSLVVFLIFGGWIFFGDLAIFDDAAFWTFGSFSVIIENSEANVTRLNIALFSFAASPASSKTSAAKYSRTAEQ